MSAALIVAAALAWWASGVAGFVYWWTSENDLTWGDLAAGTFIGACLGPLAWLVGWAMYRDDRSQVLIRRRR